MPPAIPLWGGLRRRRQRRIHRRILKEFERSVLLTQDRSTLASTFGARVRELLPTRVMALLQLDPEHGRFTPMHTFGLETGGLEAGDLAGVRLDPRGRLARWLRVNETRLVVPLSHDVLDYLDAEERELLERLDAHVCWPLITHNQLIGILLLTLEAPRRLPRGEDLEVLDRLAHQAALALENATLYEMQRLRLERLNRAERLATAGQLAAGAAHEIRNPLTAIRSTMQYLERGLENPEHREMIRGLLEEADRIGRTLDDLLQLTREGSFEPRSIDAGAVLERTLALVEKQAEQQGVVIRRRLPGAPLEIHGDPDRLRQLFLNLLLNALQAMPEGGELAVRGELMEPVYGAAGGAWVQIEISDTGGGIPPEALERIFDPFYTTKSEGTGLGLTISHRIVERHEGEIRIDTQPGRGTTLLLRFPEGSWRES